MKLHSKDLNVMIIHTLCTTTVICHAVNFEGFHEKVRAIVFVRVITGFKNDN